MNGSTNLYKECILMFFPLKLNTAKTNSQCKYLICSNKIQLQFNLTYISHNFVYNYMFVMIVKILANSKFWHMISEQISIRTSQFAF